MRRGHRSPGVIRSVHQVLPTLSPRDAVGNHTVRLQQVLLGLGVESGIYAHNIHPEMKHRCAPLKELPTDADVVLYQLSLGSYAAEAWARHDGRKLVNYHNITPTELIAGWHPVLGTEVRLGREQMARYADLCEHAICDSEFNRRELQELGYRSTETIPVLFDVDSTPPRPSTARRIERRRSRGPATQVLFVGRCAPNKCQHELVAVVHCLREMFGHDAHLHLVGDESLPAYRRVVGTVVKESRMARHVTFYGSAKPDVLAALYRGADVFCCVSDHEGFCIPVIEAMRHDLPVVAFDSSAVGDTVGDGGLRLTDKHPVTVAAALDRVAGDAALARRMVEAGRRRADDFALARTTARFAESLSSVLGLAPPAAAPDPLP
ncbi:MAG TPA: hypothetical protein DEP69_02565 [Acidimicrobiaceae bacterium]|nr:hypothetical protein [Acidimicrobiaceae bacterium]